MSAMQIKTADFESEVLKSEIPVIIDFWAEWCMPCKMIAPILDELSKEFEGKIKVGKLNVDQERELAIKYNIVSIPTILFFKSGEIVDTLIGAVPKSNIKSKIEDLL
ncbi:thioredoxin [Candidatus Dependentiae bacterium]|nr:thioredoxin [Candidatus Dependentiae bacterium]